MADAIYSLLPPSPTLPEIVWAVNRTVHRDAGNANSGQQVRWTQYGGSEVDPHTGAVSSTGNYTQILRSTATGGKHRAVLLSATSATATPSPANAVILEQDLGLSIGAGRVLRLYDVAGVDYASLSADADGGLTLAGSGVSAGLLTIGGGIVVTSLGKTFQADFSSATLGDRFVFQTSTANGATGVGVVPNGSGTASALAVFNSANMAATSFGFFQASATAVSITSSNVGATTLPIRLIHGSSTRVEADGTGVGFFGVTPVARPSALTQTYSTADRTLSSYTSDPESSGYLGIATGNPATVYAQVSDLNLLRTAYENLRVFAEDLAQFVNALVDDLQAYGLEQ